VVLGDPGIGKSALLRAAADHGRAAGLRVLAATGIEAETHLPFAGLHHLLRPVLGQVHRLPATQADALWTAFGIGDGPAPEPFMIALATLNLLAEVAAERPVLVVIDDLQWLDQPAQDVLSFLARRVSGDPVVLIGAVRKGHNVTFAAAGLPELDLRGLDDTSSRDVLARHANGLSYADTERILREAAGNPLALVELPLAVRAAGSGLDALPQVLPLTARLERTFAARIAELPPLTRDAVLVAAVDHANDLPEILAGASVLAGRPVTAAALETAMAAGLVQFDDLHVSFRHPLVRSGVLQLETVTRRHAANAALAEILVHEPYRRTWHRAQSVSGQDDEVADELEAAHLVSLRRGSATEAIWALERSAQLTTDPAKRGQRLLLAAEHAFGLGRADLVDQLLTRADRTNLSDLQRARMEWLREIFNDGVPGDAARVLQLCDIAVEAIAAKDADLALNLLLGAALRCWWADTGPAARARVAETAQLLDDAAKSDPRYPAAVGVAEPVRQAGPVIELLDGVVLENVTDPPALWLLGMASHAVGEPVHAADFLGRAETKLRQQGRLGLLCQVLAMQVFDTVELGEWDRAAAAAEEARRLAQETGQPIWDTGSLVGHAVVTALRGEHELAHRMATEVEHLAGGRRLTNLLACVQLARGIALITDGRYLDGYQELRRLFDSADPIFHLAERFHGVMFLAEAAAHAGQVTDVDSVMAGLEAEAVTTRSATLHRQLSYARAVLADDEEAEELFLSALRADLTRWPWLRARLELAYGQWLRRQRRVTQARPPLRSAQIIFDLIGASSWAAQARSELRAAGERIQAQEPSAQDMLSAQELQIARLAAEGLSNREIGERLYLSPRTVGSHLYRIFPKLEITSRAQLVARLGQA
jgi:DNA-binding CsgD family transcriptional regulator